MQSRNRPRTGRPSRLPQSLATGPNDRNTGTAIRGIGSGMPGMVRSRNMSTSLSPLLAPMLSSAAMRAVCDDVACLQNMLDFEAALARAEAAVGVIPGSAAGPITNACRAESFDLAALAEAATRSGNLAIPLVKALTANVAKDDADAARYVHWGATSQDVIDTGTMLGLRAGIDALLADTGRADRGLCQTGAPASQHARGRPHLAAARAADAVRAQARRICRSACTVRRSACSGCATRRWHCSSAAPPARSPPSATRDCRSRNGWRRNSSCRCRRRPGTPIATASRKPRPCSPFSPAPAARSPATFS